MEWISVPQLAGLLGISPRAVRKGFSKYSMTRQIDSRGGSSGKAWEIHISDPAIPEDVRRQFGGSAPKRTIKKIDEGRKMTIKGSVTPEATGRAAIIHEAQNPERGYGRTEWVEHIARKYGISRPTLFRWISEAKRGKFSRQKTEQSVVVKAEVGPLSLAIKSRSFAPQAAEFGLAMYLNHPLMNVNEIYDQLADKAKAEGWDIGSLQSFYRMTQQLPDPVTTFAKCGPRGLEALIKPPIFRDFSKYHVYEVLVGDQHIFDYAVMTEDGDVVRPQMFGWADFRSRYFSGFWPVMGNYDKYAVAFALREACRWGIPTMLYTDWGKPEGSGHIQSIRRQLDGFTAFCNWDDTNEVGVPQKKAKPRNAQAKPIESWFYHALERPLMNRNIPGYCRRDRDEKRNEFITETLRKETRGQKLLPAQAFFEIVLATLEAWHNHVMVEEKIVPAEVFETGIHEAPIAHFDDATLDLIFLPTERRQVRNSMIQATVPGHGKVKWYAPELSALCRRGKKQSVEIRFDPYDPAYAYVLDIESHEMLCVAEREGLIDPHDMETVSDKIRHQNRLMKWWKEISTTLAKDVERRIQRISPYTKAAAEVVEIDTMREAKAVDAAALDRNIISLAQQRARLAQETAKTANQ